MTFEIKSNDKIGIPGHKYSIIWVLVYLELVRGVKDSEFSLLQNDQIDLYKYIKSSPDI